MRTIKFMDENRWREKAKETLEIFLPIAVKMDNEKIISFLTPSHPPEKSCGNHFP